MSIQKQYLKSRPACKLTFRLPKKEVPDAEEVNIVGEFNNWEQDANQMKQLKDGTFKAVLEVEPGNEYQFRYLIDGENWKNDADADKYSQTPFPDAENSVVVV